MHARRRVAMAVTMMTMALLAAACGPPPAPPALPLAPRTALPAATGDGVTAMVVHREGGQMSQNVWFVDRTSQQPYLWFSADDRRLFGLAIGHIDPNTGRVLMSNRLTNPLGPIVPGGYPERLCPAWGDDTNCELIPIADISFMGFSPDGTKFATVETWGFDGGHVTIFDTETMEVIVEADAAYGNWVPALAWSPDSEALAFPVAAFPGEDRWERDLVTLAAEPGAVPQLVLAHTEGEWVYDVSGWTTTDRLVYRTMPIPVPPEGEPPEEPEEPPLEPPLPPPSALRTVGVDGSDGRTLVAAPMGSSVIPLPDGSLLTSLPLPLGPGGESRGIVVHHLTDASPSVATPRSRAVPTVIEGTTYWSATEIGALLPAQ